MFFSTVTAENSVKTDRDELLLMSDECLADLCRIEAFVGTGPGGQHRNRNYTAVRVHLKNFENIVAEESSFRSQKQNLNSALNKIRIKIAVSWRKSYPEDAVYTHLNENNPRYALELARLLDAVVQYKFDHKMAAAVTGLSGSKLLKELSRNYEVWDDFQAARAAAGLSELKKPR
jgi:hypothetical protein